MELSTEIRGDLLLDAANLNEIEKLMVLTSAHNDRSFEAISKALQEQHPRIHLKEKADKFRRRDDDKKGRGKGGWKRRSWQRRAHMTWAPLEDEYDEYAEDYDEDQEWEDDWYRVDEEGKEEPDEAY